MCVEALSEYRKEEKEKKSVSTYTLLPIYWPSVVTSKNKRQKTAFLLENEKNMKLSEWLVKRSVQAIRLQSNSEMIMYIGNEAGDLDSGESIFSYP